MVKLTSAVKRERALKRRECKADTNRALADAITRRLYSAQGRRPEKGEIKAIMKKLEHGALGGSPTCAARNYGADVVTGRKRSEEPPKADKPTAGAEAMADKEADEDPKAVTGSSDEGVEEEVTESAERVGSKRGWEDMEKKDKKRVKEVSQEEGEEGGV